MPHRVRTPDDPTARLRLAARTGKASALHKLLGKDRARVNDARDEDGWTALHLACFWGHVECVKALLGAGAVVDLADIEGRTALHMACLYGEAASVQLLLDANADTSLLAGRAGKTALEYAHESGSTSCATMLVAHDAACFADEVEVVGELSKADKDAELRKHAVHLDTPTGTDRLRKRPVTEATAAAMQHGVAKRRRRPSAGELPKLRHTREVVVLD